MPRTIHAPAGPIDLAAPVARAHPLNRGRVAWWLAPPGLAGGATARDLLGGAALALSGGAGWGYGPTGFGALAFGGASGQTADFGASSALDLPGAGAFACWFRRLGAPASYHNLVARLDAASNGYQVYLSSAGALSFYNGANVASSFTLAAGDAGWHHYLVTWGGGLVYFTVDGMPAGSGPTAVPSIASPAYHAVGGFPAGGTCNGTIAGATLWGRTLGVAEAQVDYDQSRRGYPGTLRRAGRRPAVVPAPAAPAFLAAWATPSATLGTGVY